MMLGISASVRTVVPGYSAVAKAYTDSIFKEQKLQGVNFMENRPCIR